MDKPLIVLLGAREHEALMDIAKWGDDSPYIWKQATMRRLEAKGLVRQTGQIYTSLPVYVLTDLGKQQAGIGEGRQR